MFWARKSVVYFNMNKYLKKKQKKLIIIIVKPGECILFRGNKLPNSTYMFCAINKAVLRLYYLLHL